MGQTRFLIAAAFAFSLLMLDAAAVAAEAQQRHFHAFRKGEPIGHHRATVSSDGVETRVTVDIALLVKVMGFLPVYRYHHQSEEVWREGRLISLSSTTDDNGEKQYLNAAAAEGGVRIDGTKYKGMAPVSIMPTSYWNGAFPRHRQLLDTQNGRLLDVRVTELEARSEDGVPRGSKHYKLDGDLKVEIWYDPQGRWAKTRFGASDGSVIDYQLQE